MTASSRGKSPLLAAHELFLSLKYLRSRFSSIAALLAVTFGVAVILIVLSIMGGYIEVLKETLRGQESHLMLVGKYGSNTFPVTQVVELEEAIRAVPNVKGTAPFIETLAMYKWLQLNPCQLRGIEPRSETEVSDIGRYVLRTHELELVLQERQRQVQAQENDRENKSAIKKPVAMVEAILRDRARQPLSADEIANVFEPEFQAEILRERNPATLALLKGRPLPAMLVGIHFLLENKMRLGEAVQIGTVKPGRQDQGAEQLASEQFVVVGAFRTGDYDFDSRAAFVNVNLLKNLLGLFDPDTFSYRYQGVRIALKDLKHSDATQAEVEKVVAGIAPHLRVISWEQLKGNTLMAVLIEKWVIYFLLVLLMSFTGCMVLLMLLLTVIEKTRDMGVLLALGATPASIVRIFLSNGLTLVGAGTMTGLVLGYTFCHYINPLHDWIHDTTGWRLFPPEIYHMDRIPITFNMLDVLLSIAPPLILGFLSSLIPAIWAARRDPIKAIHYE